jgi:hypothetical protein
MVCDISLIPCQINSNAELFFTAETSFYHLVKSYLLCRLMLSGINRLTLKPYEYSPDDLKAIFSSSKNNKKAKANNSLLPLKFMVARGRLELPTFGL